MKRKATPFRQWVGALAAVLLAVSTAASGAPTLELGNGEGLDSPTLVELEVGKSTVLIAKYPVKRVSVGNPDVADVNVIGSRQINLVAKSIGETNVVLWDRKGQPQTALNVAVGRPFGAAEAKIREILGNAEVQVTSAGESIVLKGRAPNLEAADQAMRVAKAFFPEKDDESKIINLLEVGGHQQVMIEVTIAEMSRTVTKEIEANFVAATQASDGKSLQIFNFLEGLTSLDDDPLSSAILLSDRVNLAAGLTGFGTTSVDLFLNLLEEKGLVKVLAEPNLVARSGQSARFLAGGEVPIPISQGGSFGSITVEFKEFGVKVDFTPTVLDPNRIHLEITPEVSEPDFTIGTVVEGFVVPGFATRRASTGVELGDGQTFAIAGLLREELRQQASQYPFFGDIPILGTLFRSKQYLRNESELVMIVRPRIVKPMAAGDVELPTDDYVEPGDLEFYFTSSLEGHSHNGTHDWWHLGGLIGKTGHQASIDDAEEEF